MWVLEGQLTQGMRTKNAQYSLCLWYVGNLDIGSA